MRKLNGRELKALFALSIVVPVGLLATLRITGILQEPPALETITAEPVSWEMDRPRKTVEFVDERIENALSNDEASVGIGVQIHGYRDDTLSDPYEGRDGIRFSVYVNATLKPGFTSSFEIRFYPIDSEAFVDVTPEFQVRHNVTVMRMKHIGTNTKEAYISATTTNSSSYLRVQPYWVFQDQNIKGHQLKVVLEFTYRNTSIYRKIMLPILLEMVPDVGNTFDTAKNIAAGEYRGCLDSIDYIDIYAITLQEGRSIYITLEPPKDANYNLYLYNPKQDMVTNSTQTGNTLETVISTTSRTGIYYIKVKHEWWIGHKSRGVYTLEIKVESA